MTARPLVFAAAVLAAAALSGCGPGKLDVAKTAEITGFSPMEFDIDPYPKPQTVTVEYESTPAELEVGIWKASDINPDALPPTDKALKFEKGKASGALAADVPADTPLKVVVGTLKGKTTVKVRITNQK